LPTCLRLPIVGKNRESMVSLLRWLKSWINVDVDIPGWVVM
jgi:hypothetical protein